MTNCTVASPEEILVAEVVLDAVANAELAVLQLVVPLQVGVGVARLRVERRIMLVRVVAVQLRDFL